MKQSRLLFLSIFLALFVAGCGAELSPEQTAEKYLRAMKAGDKVAAKKFVRDADKPRVESWVPIIIADPGDITVENAQISGDTAIVVYSDKDIKKEVTLVKEKGKWKVIFEAPVLPPHHRSPNGRDEERV